MSSIESVLSGADRYHVECCRAEDLCDRLPAGCVQLIAVDHPYHGAVDADWDNAWPTVDAFLDWTSEMLRRYRRVLAPNGSLYVFARPTVEPGTATLGSLVEQRVAEHFQVLCSIRWRKPGSRGDGTRKEDLRAPFPASEVIIFAEQRGFTCEPVRAYLDGQLRLSGVSVATVRDAIGFTGQMPYHWFARGMPEGKCKNWQFPTEEHYSALKRIVRGFFLRSYEDLSREYEDLRRPFTVSADVPYTDVWDYATVGKYDGKHPCEKPFDMGLDIVSASSRADGIVLDCFSGSGTFPAAAVALGRRTVACDMDPHWAEQTRQRCARAAEHPELARRNPRKAKAFMVGQGDLFSAVSK